MFKLMRVSDDRLDIEMSGKLDSKAMIKALDELIEKSEGIENGKMLYDVVDYHLPSLGAVGVELSRIPAMFGFINKFNRAAVLSNKAWLKTISEIEGRLMPGLEIKAFSREEKSEAEAWLENQT
jgi:hypothetical protein